MRSPLGFVSHFGRFRLVWVSVFYLLFGAGMLALAAIVLSPLVLKYDTVEFRPLERRIGIETRRWLQRTSDADAGIVETGLVPLHLESTNLEQLAGALVGGSGAIAADGERLMLADRSGQFFAVDLADGAPSVEPLPLRLDLHEDELLAFADGRGVIESTLLSVWELVLLQDGGLAVSYSQWDTERDCVSLFVAVTDLPDDWSAASNDGWRTIFESQPCLPLRLDGGELFTGNQAGGRILEAAPGKLLLTVGDFHFDGVNRSPVYPQDPDADYGKVFELDVADGARRMVSMGHRNPQGLVRDRNGRIWVTEHGPEGGADLNLVRPGANYGWPAVTLGSEYGSYGWPPSPQQGRHGGYEAPVYAWLPSVAVSNLIEVRNFAEAWNGDFLVASLGAQQLRRLRLDGTKVVYDEPIALAERIRDIDQLGDGRIVLWTDSAKLLILEEAREPDPIEQRIAALDEPVRTAVNSCRRCHSLRAQTVAGNQITLWGVVGRDIADGGGALYSDALQRIDGRWDAETLDSFLADPAKMAPGTTMQYAGISDQAVRADVVSFLAALE